MNDDTAPLEPDELDELLSADLDGELAAAARERGSDVDAVRARIAATPEAAERRVALSAARDLLADAPELTEIDAARLRANAVRAAEATGPVRDAAQRERRSRVLLAVSGIAACILVVAGIAFATSRSSSSSSSNQADSASPPRVSAHTNNTAPAPALGTYRDVRRLGSAALDEARRRDATTFDAAAGSGAAGAPVLRGPARAGLSTGPTTLAPAASQSPLRSTPDDLTQKSAYRRAVENADGTAQSTSKSSNKALRGCSPATFAGSGDELLMQASATLNGRPVLVYVFAGHGEHTVVVLAKNCELVNVQTID
jgi:hypothetical protein